MIKVAVIGGGNHSSQNHLPALKHYLDLHPGELKLAAVCDLCQEIAQNVAQKFGFEHWYTNIVEMLKSEELDACLAITPISATADVAKHIILAGIPLLIEKPPGATVEEARLICDLVKKHNAWVMVSMNRRFDPAISLLCSQLKDRQLKYIRGAMYRVQRTESDFFIGTAIHALDTMRFIAGDIRTCSVSDIYVDNIRWYRVDIEFEKGIQGCLDVLPTCGQVVESYELLCSGVRMLASAGGLDSGEMRVWEDGELIVNDEPARGMPIYIKNGTYAETEAFFSTLMEIRAPDPGPMDVLQSVEYCHRIQTKAISL